MYRALLNFEKIYNEMTDLEKKEFYQNFIEEVQVHQDRDRSDRMVKSISFNFPLYYNGNVGDTVVLPKDKNVETVVLLSHLRQKPDDFIDVDIDVAELEGTSAETKATFEKIKKYVAEHNDGMKVSNLYIAQVKRKCGIELAENFNLPKSEDARQPRCPKEKEEAIVEALKAFQMI